ncbi:MAG: 6-phosphogluconolactonase [Woeseiaceae bacterium]|nr:6-phosphogluconolactonase [Woeseiaceae bacterium]
MQENKFQTRQEASQAAADDIVNALSRRLASQGDASLVVSGGTSPVDCLAELSRADIEWARVHVLPSDERWVASTDESSNENMIRNALLTNKASVATLHGLYDPCATVDERCEQIGVEFKTLPFPFAAALLGMGADGHFASLFPDADNLERGLNPDFAGLCLPVRTIASPYERISLTLSALSRSDEIALLIFGDDKWATLQSAKEKNSKLPVARLIKQKRAPVTVYWAP